MFPKATLELKGVLDHSDSVSADRDNRERWRERERERETGEKSCLGVKSRRDPGLLRIAVSLEKKNNWKKIGRGVLLQNICGVLS